MPQISASASFINWEELTGQSQFIVDMVSIPIFSAIAGLITNWTGVLMLFAPTNFTGFYVPGLKTLFPLLPRKVQILPIFAPNGILGFQGFIPCRAEKMASLIVDMSIARIGGIADFYQQLEPDKMAEDLARAARPNIRNIATEIIENQHSWLWDVLPGPVRESVLATVDDELPAISRRAFAKVGEHIDDLLNVKLMTVNHLRRHPAVLSDIFKGMGDPELRFMVKIGALGFVFGIPLALYLTFVREQQPPILSAVPSWLIVLAGAAIIGVVVNILAIKVVFEPGDPQPRYKYLWRQGIFPKRQYEAAEQVAVMLSEKVLTVTNFSRELLVGASGDKTASYLAEAVAEEVDRVLTPAIALVGHALGAVNLDALQQKASQEIVSFAPEVFESKEFNEAKAKRIAAFATEKFRALPPAEFSEMLYAAIEQDAWLLYVHGGLLGVLVGAVHLLLFGW
ncbi:MAG TPA: hypothetical protein VFR17_02840 [Mycobacterium sp.]|nr:hypothetical protein [Mycobacterium sp.]